MADRSMQDEMARFEAEISAVASTGSPSIRPAMIPPSVTLMMNRPRGVLPPPPPPPMFLPSQLTHRIAAPQPLASTTVASSGPAVISAAPKVYISKSGSSFAISAAAPTISILKPPSAVPASIAASQSTVAQIPKDVITLPDPTPATPVVKPKPTTSGLSKYAIPNTKPRKKPKKIVRAAGGQVWEDNSLLDWDPDDFRIFCGDLGNDVTDETLARAFGRFPSFQKAKVIRDKRSNKTKGFGFVSFKDPQDFIRAMKEMNGRYVGSRPIKLRKSSWKNRNIGEVTKKQKEKTALGLR